MVKGNKAATAATTTEPQAAPPVPVLQVKQGMQYRGARAAWYAVLLQHNGQPAAAYLAATTANPPSLPTKGKNAGRPEPASGWLAYFVRQGVATLVPPQC
jgi:hypothetical protein